MKQLLKFLKPYRKESILGPLFKLLEASFELLVPLVIKAIIDTGINGDGGRPYIVKMCLVLIALGLIGMLCSFTAQFFAAKAATGFAADVRHALFKHLEGLSFTEIDRIGTSTMITRMTSDVNLLQNGVNLTLRLLLRSPFVVIGAMIMAFFVDFKAALVFAVVIPVLAVIVFGIMLITMPIYKRAQKALDAVLKSTRENLGGIRVIRAFCKEYSETEEFNVKNEALTDIQKYVGKISALMNPVTYVVINVGVIALIYVGALRVESGILLQGGVVALYNYMSQILVELIKLANMIISLTKAIAGGNRVADVLNEKSTFVPGNVKSGSSGGSVEFKNVNLVYSGSKEAALEDISFKVDPGETIGIIGGTGSGKSSLVHLIPRFYDAASGTVTVDGIDVREYDVNALRDKIGIVMQKAVLFKGSIRENIRWGKPDATDNEIKEAIAIAQATDIIDGKGGLDYEIEQGGKNLSGGQRQRMTIARALVKKPEILILDDSASALDFATDAALRKAIRDMDSAPTTFIVSQRAASVMYADKIIVLDDGRIAAKGSHKELLEGCKVYSEIYYSQFPKEVRG